MNRKQKIKAVKKLTGEKEKLTWAKLCSLTEFDSFATLFSFGFGWNENCPDEKIEAMPDSYLNMIIFNVTAFPKGLNDASKNTNNA